MGDEVHEKGLIDPKTGQDVPLWRVKGWPNQYADPDRDDSIGRVGSRSVGREKDREGLYLALAITGWVVAFYLFATLISGG